jgi:FKBP-type peptidyl-prolyl cis-trans isomerase
MKKLILSVTVLTFGAGVYAQTKTPAAKTSAGKTTTGKTAAALAPKPLKNGVDSLSYAIGVNVAAYFKQQGVDHLNYAAVDRAFMEVFAGKKQVLTDEQAVTTIKEKLGEFAAKKTDANKEEGKRFLAENKKRPGVFELNDGLQYEVIRRGTGPQPSDTSTVKVNYTGYLLNGKKFDASSDHNGPVTFPLNRVIRGWTEGLRQMSVGSTYKFYIPSDLAYGDNGAGGSIPGGSTLIFQVDLLAIVATPAEPVDPSAPQGGAQPGKNEQGNQ